MIERNKKTTEITMGDKLVNKNNINSKKKKKENSLLNEFVGGNKLINENNIIIQMPEEAVKKKRKKKQKKGITQAGEIQQGEKKISDIAKINYQETLNKFQAGNYPKFPMPDITTIKTDADLNKITNMMKLQMNETPLPIDNLGTRTNISSPIAPPITTPPIPSPITTPPITTPPIIPIKPIKPIPMKPIQTQTEKFTEDEIKIYKLLDILTEFYHDIKNDKNVDKLRYDVLSYYIIHESFFRSLSNKQLRIYIIAYIELIFPLSFTNQDKRDILEFYIETINKIKNEIKPMTESIEIQKEPDNSINVITEEKDNKIEIINEEKDKLKEYNKRLQLDYIKSENEKETLKNEIKKIKSQFEQEKLTLTNAEKKKNEKILKKEITEKEVLIQKIENQTKQIKELLKENDNYSKRLSELEGSNETVLVLNELVEEIENTNSNLQISNEELQQGKKLLEDEIEKLKEENIKLQEINTEKSKEKQQENINAIDDLKKIADDEKENLETIKELDAIEENLKTYLLQLPQKLRDIFEAEHEQVITEKVEFDSLREDNINHQQQSTPVFTENLNLPEVGGEKQYNNDTQPRLSPIQSSPYSQNTGGEDLPPPTYEQMIEDNEKDPTIVKLRNFVDLYWRLEDGKIIFTPIIERKLVSKDKITNFKHPDRSELIRMGDTYFNYNKTKNYYKLRSKIHAKSGKFTLMTVDEIANEFIKDFLVLNPKYFETQVSTPVKKLSAKEFYDKHYPNGIFDKLATVDELLEYIKPFRETDETLRGITKASGKNRLSELFKQLMNTQPETQPEPQPETTIPETITPETTTPETTIPKAETGEQCLESNRRDINNCIKITDYYRYLNDLSTKNEIQELTDQYIKATGDDFNSINATNKVKIEKIIESNYTPTGKNNPEFFDWAEAEKMKAVETITPIQEIAFLTPDEYKRSIVLLTVENDTDKINAYFKGLQQWNADNGNFERIPRNISIEDKLGMLIRYKNQYQYTDINEAVKRKKPLIDNNEVQLCFEICKATYLEPSAREGISQLDYDDSLSNAEVAIYRDTITNIIYFGSRGSQTAEDWLKSDLAIVFGGATPNYSPRLNNEITILNQVISIYRPTTIIYTGHSLSSYLSDELFIYTLKSLPTITQVFSIGFNGGRGLPAYYRDNPFNQNFINTHVLQFHIKGDLLSMTQRYAPFGTLVNVPVSSFLLIPNHFLSAYDDFSFVPYTEFVNRGLTIPNPDQVVEETTEPEIKETDKEKDLKLMNYFNELWEMNRNDFDTTETFRTTEAYYNKNKEYFDSLNEYGLKVMMITKYIDNKQTVRSNRERERYPFFINLFDRLSGINIIDENRQTTRRPDTAITQPEQPAQPEDTGGYVDYEAGTNVENRPEYETPYGGYIGGTLGTLAGGITSGGNPIVAGGAGAAGFLAGNAIQNAIEGKPSTAQPIGSFGGGRRDVISEPPILFKPDKPGTVYVPSTF